MILTNNLAIPLVSGFELVGHGVFDVHSPVKAMFETEGGAVSREMKLPPPVMTQSMQPYLIDPYVELAFYRARQDLCKAAMARNTTALFGEWSKAFEQGLIRAEGGTQKTMGRGKPTVIEASKKAPKKVATTSDELDSDLILDMHGNLLTTRRCLRHLAALARVHRPERGREWPVELVRVHAACVRKIRARGLIEARVGSLQCHSSSWHRVVLAASADVVEIDKEARRLGALRRAEKRATLKQSLDCPSKGLGHMMRVLRAPAPARLAFLQGPEGPTAAPEKVDELAQAEWGAHLPGQPGSQLQG